MKRINIIIAAMLAVFAVACQKPEDSSKDPQSAADVLTITTSEFYVSNAGAQQQIKFTTNAGWIAASDQSWATLDQASGKEGDITLNVSVAPNEDFDARTASITITAGKLSSTITIHQGESESFSTAVYLNIDGAEQDIEIAVATSIEYNVEVDEDSPWLSVAQTKADPVEGVIKIHAEAFYGGSVREGAFYISNKFGVQEYIVIQTGQPVIIESAEASYLGNRVFIYDPDEGLTSFGEYLIVLSAENGDEVTLAVNNTNELGIDGIPAGAYVVDPTAKHAEYTFTVQNLAGTEAFTTHVVTAAGESVDIIDGDIKITSSEAGYVITVDLFDEEGNEYPYIFDGEIDEIADDSFGLQITEVVYSNYKTYFAGNNDIYSLTVYLAPNPGVEEYLYYLGIDLVVANGTDRSSLPAGTYTYDASLAESPSGNGLLEAKPGTFVIKYPYTKENGGVELAVAGHNVPELVISEEGGFYSIELKDAEFLESKHVLDEDGWWVYDEDWNPIFEEVGTFDFSFIDDKTLVPEPQEGNMAKPDGDFEFTKPAFGGSAGLWLGDAFDLSEKDGEGNVTKAANTMILGWASGIQDSNYVVYLCLTVTEGWEWEINYASRFCNTPFPAGKYEYSTVPGNFTLVPVRYGASNVYCYVTNNYTGTKYDVCGGSIDYQQTSVTFDLQAKSERDGSIAHFTGTIADTFGFHQNWSSRAANFHIYDPNESGD